MNTRNDFNALVTVPAWASDLITAVEKGGAYTRVPTDGLNPSRRKTMPDIQTPDDELIAKWHEGDTLTPAETARLDQIMTETESANRKQPPPPKRISIYPSETLWRVLNTRAPRDDGEARSRSSLVSAILDRYDEICRRDLPLFSLAEWLLIFDALKSCWTREPASLSVQGVAMEIADADALERAGAKWGVPDVPALAQRIDALPFAARVAIIDAAERFRAHDTQLGIPGLEAEPHAAWRAAVRAIVWRLADDPEPHP